MAEDLKDAIKQNAVKIRGQPRPLSLALNNLFSCPFSSAAALCGLAPRLPASGRPERLNATSPGQRPGSWTQPVREP